MGITVYEHGATKFPTAGLLKTSQPRGWTGVAAELRRHPGGDLPPFTSSQLELTLAVSGDARARVRRSGGGVRQDTSVRPGTIWLCPIGVSEDAVHITQALPEILHVYLPASRLAEVAEERGTAALSPGAIDYVADVEDDLLRQMALAIFEELQSETAGGKLLVESLGLAMAARLANSHSSSPSALTRPDAAGSLHGARLRRVLDFIADHDDQDLTVAELAAVACLSRFHFARAFRDATGAPPHRYISARRLERAKRMLRETATPLADIALDCSFSSQANFTRAFRRATGLAPGEYRRLSKSHH